MIEKILEMLETLYSMNEKTKRTAYEEQDWEKFDLFMHRNEGVYFATKIVREVAKEYGNGWIPCSERLPENTESVLITTAFEVVMMAFLGTSKKWCYPNGRRIGDSQDMPIAWQPLPAPYQKGE